MQVFGPGTQCWKSGGSDRIGSTNWFFSKPGKRTLGSLPGTSDKECVTPTSFNYVDAAGVDRSIVVGSKEASEAIANHYIAGNYTALASYPACTCICSIALFDLPADIHAQMSSRLKPTTWTIGCCL